MPMLRSLSSDTLLPSRSAKGASRPGLRKQLKKSNSSKSLRNVMGGMKLGVTGVADGMKHGVTGVADIGKAGAAYGLAGVSNAAELAKKGAMMGGVNVPHLGRAKPSTYRRRQSEFNVLGGSIVSQNFLLQNIKAAEKNNKLTKLELEDLVHGQEDPAIFEAVSSLLKNDGGRQWLYIKFIDSLRVGVFGDGLQELQQYEKKRQALWDKIKPNAAAKPIMFSLKVEIEEDTPAATVIDILKELLGYNLVRVEYMGGLFGYKAPEIAEALADLCRPDDPLASIEEIGELKEMILFNLHYAAGGSETNSGGGKSNSPTRDRVWRKVLRRCVKRLGGQVPPSLGDSEHGLGTRSRSGRSKSPTGKGRSPKTSHDSRNTASGNEKHSSNRSLSPPKTRATDPAILPGPAAIARPKAVARRAISEGMLVQMPTMRRAVSMPDANPNSLGSSSTHHHKKRRKPRSFANPIHEVDDTTDDDDNDDDTNGGCDLHGSRGSIGSMGSMGDDSFADDSSSRGKNSDNETKEDKKSSSISKKKGDMTEGKKRSSSKSKREKSNNKASSSSSRPSRRDSELRRSLSSPNLDGGHKEKKKGIKRSTSLKRESSSDRKENPSYDWSKHSYHTAVTSA